jgi:hypothetical protein
MSTIIKNFTKFTELEKQVIRGWVELITTNFYQYPYDSKTFEKDLHSAISYITFTAEELSEASEIPTKKLRGVLSSLVKKNVFYEDISEESGWFGKEIIVFRADGYFWSESALGDQETDCDMDKIYDAIK